MKNPESSLFKSIINEAKIAGKFSFHELEAKYGSSFESFVFRALQEHLDFIDILTDVLNRKKSLNEVITSFDNDDILRIFELIAVLYYNLDETKQSLKREQYFFQLLAENTVECIWLLNFQTGRFVFISPSVFQLRGLTVEEAMNESMFDSLTPASIEKVSQLATLRLTRFMAGERGEDVVAGIDEYEQYHKDGRVLDVEMSTRLLFNEETNAVEVLGVTRDITQKKILENEILKRNKELAVLNIALYEKQENLNAALLEIATINGELLQLNKSKDKILQSVEKDINNEIEQIRKLVESKLDVEFDSISPDEAKQKMTSLKNEISTVLDLLPSLFKNR